MDRITNIISNEIEALFVVLLWQLRKGPQALDLNVVSQLATLLGVLRRYIQEEEHVENQRRELTAPWSNPEDRYSWHANGGAES